MRNIYLTGGSGGMANRIVKFGREVSNQKWRRIVESFWNGESMVLSVDEGEETVVLNLDGHIKGEELYFTATSIKEDDPSVVTVYKVYGDEHDNIKFERKMKSSDSSVQMLVNGKHYESLSEAFAALEDGDEVVLMQNVETPEMLTINKSVSIDMNGNEVYTAEKIDAAFFISDGVEVEIRNGTLDSYSHIESWDPENDYNMALWVKDGTVKLYDVNCSAGYEAVYVNKGVVEIYGGHFFAQPDSSRQNKLFELNCQDKPYKEGLANIVVYGGEYEDFDPAANASETMDMSTNFVAKGYKSIKEGNIYKVVKE